GAGFARARHRATLPRIRRADGFAHQRHPDGPVPALAAPPPFQLHLPAAPDRHRRARSVIAVLTGTAPRGRRRGPPASVEAPAADRPVLSGLRRDRAPGRDAPALRRPPRTGIPSAAPPDGP